jgi:hypothetical protein
MTTINSSKARVSTATIITLPWYKHEVGNDNNYLALLLLTVVIAYFMFVSR